MLGTTLLIFSTGNPHRWGHSQRSASGEMLLIIECVLILGRVLSNAEIEICIDDDIVQGFSTSGPRTGTGPRGIWPPGRRDLKWTKKNIYNYCTMGKNVLTIHMFFTICCSQMRSVRWRRGVKTALCGFTKKSALCGRGLTHEPDWLRRSTRGAEPEIATFLCLLPCVSSYKAKFWLGVLKLL